MADNQVIPVVKTQMPPWGWALCACSAGAAIVFCVLWLLPKREQSPEKEAGREFVKHARATVNACALQRPKKERNKLYDQTAEALARMPRGELQKKCAFFLSVNMAVITTFDEFPRESLVQAETELAKLEAELK